MWWSKTKKKSAKEEQLPSPRDAREQPEEFPPEDFPPAPPPIKRDDEKQKRRRGWHATEQPEEFPDEAFPPQFEEKLSCGLKPRQRSSREMANEDTKDQPEEFPFEEFPPAPKFVENLSDHYGVKARRLRSTVHRSMEGGENSKERPKDFPCEDFPCVPQRTPLHPASMNRRRTKGRRWKGRKNTKDQPKENPPEEVPPSLSFSEDKPSWLHGRTTRRWRTTARMSMPEIGGECTRNQAVDFVPEVIRSASVPEPLNPKYTKGGRVRWKRSTDKAEHKEEVASAAFPVLPNEMWSHTLFDSRRHAPGVDERNSLSVDREDALGHSQSTSAPWRAVNSVAEEQVEPALPAPGAEWIYPNESHSDVPRDDVQALITEEHGDDENIDNEDVSLLPLTGWLPLAVVDVVVGNNNRFGKDLKRRRLHIASIILLTIIVAVVAVSIALSREFSPQQDGTSTTSPSPSTTSPSPSTSRVPTLTPSLSTAPTVPLVALFGRAWDPERTARIDLGNHNLGDTIPAEIGMMTQLTYLNLRLNLVGTIPTIMGLLTKLISLSLGSNSLDGTIPTTIGLLTQLIHLNLASNSLDGSIPVTIGLLTRLTRLSLGSNSLNGSIPTTMGLLTKLTGLTLSRNSLDGSIPMEIGSLTNLQRLWLYSNTLSGPLPTTALANLVNLSTLHLYDNTLSGSIPSSLCSVLSPLIDCDKIACNCCQFRNASDCL